MFKSIATFCWFKFRCLRIFFSPIIQSPLDFIVTKCYNKNVTICHIVRKSGPGTGCRSHDLHSRMFFYIRKQCDLMSVISVNPHFYSSHSTPPPHFFQFYQNLLCSSTDFYNSFIRFDPETKQKRHFPESLRKVSSFFMMS